MSRIQMSEIGVEAVLVERIEVELHLVLTEGYFSELYI